MATTPNLALTILEEAQAHPEIVENANFVLLDDVAFKIHGTGTLGARPAQPVARGFIYFSTDTPRTIWRSDGAAWISLIVEGGAGGLGDHSHTGPGQGGALAGDVHNTFSRYVEQSATPAAPPPGSLLLYAKTDGKFYQLDPSGVETLLGGSGGGGGAGHTIQDEGTALAGRAGLNFRGTGVTASDDGANNRTNVDIAAGAPLGASYVVLAADPTLTAEAVLATSVIKVGTLNARPATDTAGVLYLATDDAGGTLYRYSGAGWQQCGKGVGAASGHTLLDEGVGLPQRPNLDFTGGGVTASDDSANSKTVVNVPTPAPTGASYVTLAADATLTNEAVLGTAVIMLGTLALRPSTPVPAAGVCYFATDDNGGTLYRSTGAAWQPIAPGLGAVAPSSASYVTMAAESGLSNESVLGTAVIRVGTIGARPAATAVIPGVVYLATDDNGGTLYRSNGTIWQQCGAAVNSAAGGSGHAIQDEGTALSQRVALNFRGAGVTASDDAANNRTNVDVAAGHTVQDEGVSLAARGKMNFAGTGVVATDDAANDATLVTINVSGDTALRTDLADPAANKGDALVVAKLPVTGAAQRTVHARLQDMWTVCDFGAIPDGTTDCLAAFNAAIAAMSAPLTGTGAKLRLPKGVFRLSGPLHVTRNLVLEGEGGSGWSPATTLLFDAGQSGIIVDRSGTAPDGGAGDWSVIRDLAVFAAGKTTLAHGIQMNARANLENLLIRGFSGDGIHIVANSVSGTNANLWRIAYCRSEQNTGHGLYVDGVDVNAGMAHNLDCSDNGGWGVYDSSFLGNTYVGCHSASNGGSYKTDEVNAKNVLIGCYSELGQMAAELAPRTLVIGGEHGAGFATTTLAPFLSGTDLREFQVEHGITAFNATGGVGIRASLGKSDVTNTALEFYSDDINNHYRIRYQLSGQGWWDLVYGNLGDKIVMSFSTGAAPEGSGLIKFPNGLLLMAGQLQRNVIVGVSMPNDAQGGAGDMVFDWLPQPGQPMGWIKTAEAPNHWKPFGIIDILNVANTWRSGQLINGALGFVQMALPGPPPAGQGILYLTTDGHLHFRNAANDLDLSAGGGGGGGGDHNHTGIGDGGTLTDSLFDGYIDWAPVPGSPGAGPGGAPRMYALAGGIWQILGRLSVTNSNAVNDPIAEFGGTDVNQSNSVRAVFNFATELRNCAVGVNGHFLAGSQAGDILQIITGGRLLFAKDASGAFARLDNGLFDSQRISVNNGTPMTGHVSATTSWDPPSLAPGDWVTVSVPLAGAAVGDLAACGLSVVLPDGCAFAQPQAVAGAVVCTLHNWSTGTVDLPAATLRASITKH